MSRKTVLVTGATGLQGGSVARHLLRSGKYNVRCLSRNTASDKARALRHAGGELVAGDLGDHASLKAAMAGCDVVFGVTNFWEHFERERQHGANLVDDDCNCLLKFDSGAKGVLHASQIAIGEENNLAIWVHGEKASLEWHQEHPNYLHVWGIDQPVEVWRRGNGYVGAKSPAAARATLDSDGAGGAGCFTRGGRNVAVL
jgi:predicted dehydrogenase